jgi:hypothetical protein
MNSTDKQLLSIAQQFQGLPMEDLIGGPLNSAAKANAAMALSQTSFLMDTCFYKTDGGYKPVMIDMVLERSAITPNGEKAEIQTFTTKFSLPLLSVISLNSLAVTSVSIDFEMEVKSSFSESENEKKESSSSGSGSFETKLGWGPLKTTVKGTASYSSKDSATHDTHYEKSNSAKYTVSVRAGQLPLPTGINTIIAAYSSCIQPVELPAVVQPTTDGDKPQDNTTPNNG